MVSGIRQQVPVFGVSSTLGKYWKTAAAGTFAGFSQHLNELLKTSRKKRKKPNINLFCEIKVVQNSHSKHVAQSALK